MMVTTVRIDGWTKNLILLLKTQNNYIRKIPFPKLNQG